MAVDEAVQAVQEQLESIAAQKYAELEQKADPEAATEELSEEMLKAQAACPDGWPTTHLVPSLPQWDSDATFPCMYAGTLPSNADGSHQLFYWMYPAADFDNAPLAIWLNGGPGASSTFANFLMNGPMRIEKTGTTDADYRVYLAEQGSWVDAATMIFIDQPVGTGFSYGEPLLTTMDEAATEFVYFLDQIWNMYTAFPKKDLYMTGESYAGKYIPRFSVEILNTNESLGEARYNLLASLVGDPYTAPLTQRTHMYLVPQALNILDDSNMGQIATLNRRCQEILSSDMAAADETCGDIMGYIETVSGGVFPYDNRIFGYDWDP